MLKRKTLTKRKLKLVMQSLRGLVDSRILEPQETLTSELAVALSFLQKISFEIPETTWMEEKLAKTVECVSDIDDVLNNTRGLLADENENSTSKDISLEQSFMRSEQRKVKGPDPTRSQQESFTLNK